MYNLCWAFIKLFFKIFSNYILPSDVYLFDFDLDFCKICCDMLKQFDDLL